MKDKDQPQGTPREGDEHSVPIESHPSQHGMTSPSDVSSDVLDKNLPQPIHYAYSNPPTPPILPSPLEAPPLVRNPEELLEGEQDPWRQIPQQPQGSREQLAKNPLENTGIFAQQNQSQGKREITHGSEGTQAPLPPSVPVEQRTTDPKGTQKVPLESTGIFALQNKGNQPKYANSSNQSPLSQQTGTFPVQKSPNQPNPSNPQGPQGQDMGTQGLQEVVGNREIGGNRQTPQSSPNLSNPSNQSTLSQQTGTFPVQKSPNQPNPSNPQGTQGSQRQDMGTQGLQEVVGNREIGGNRQTPQSSPNLSNPSNQSTLSQQTGTFPVQKSPNQPNPSNPQGPQGSQGQDMGTHAVVGSREIGGNRQTPQSSPNLSNQSPLFQQTGTFTVQKEGIREQQAVTQQDTQPLPQIPRQQETQPLPQIPRQQDTQPLPQIPRQQDTQPLPQIPRQQDTQPLPQIPLQQNTQPLPQIPRQQNTQPLPQIPRQQDTQPLPQIPRQQDTQPLPQIPRQQDTQPLPQIPRQQDSQPLPQIPRQQDTQPLPQIPRQQDTQPLPQIPRQQNTQPLPQIPRQQDTQPLPQIPRQQDTQPLPQIPRQQDTQPLPQIPRQQDTQPLPQIPRKQDTQPLPQIPRQQDTQPLPQIPRQQNTQPLPQIPRQQDTQPLPQIPRQQDTQPLPQIPRQQDTQPLPQIPRQQDTQPLPQIPRLQDTQPLPQIPRRQNTQPLPQIPRQEDTQPLPQIPRQQDTQPLPQIPRTQEHRPVMAKIPVSKETTQAPLIVKESLESEPVSGGNPSSSEELVPFVEKMKRNPAPELPPTLNYSEIPQGLRTPLPPYYYGDTVDMDAQTKRFKSIDERFDEFEEEEDGTWVPVPTLPKKVPPFPKSEPSFEKKETKEKSAQKNGTYEEEQLSPSLIQLAEPNIVVTKPPPSKENKPKTPPPPPLKQGNQPLIDLKPPKVTLTGETGKLPKLEEDLYDTLFDLESIPKREPVYTPVSEEEEKEEDNFFSPDDPMYEFITALREPLPTEKFSKQFLGEEQDDDFSRIMQGILEDSKVDVSPKESLTPSPSPEEVKSRRVRTPYKEKNLLTSFKELAFPKESLPNEGKQMYMVGVMVALSFVISVAVMLFYLLGHTTEEAVSIVQLDVNPSVQLSVTKDQKVTDVVGINQDGIQLLEGLNLTGETLENALYSLILILIDREYVQNSSAIYATVEDSNQGRGETLSVDVKKYLDSAINNEGKTALSVGLWVDPAFEFTEKAEEYGITLGKMVIIEEINRVNQFFTVEQLATLTQYELYQLFATGSMLLPVGMDRAVELARQEVYLSDTDNYITVVQSRLTDPLPHYQVRFTTSTKEFLIEVDGYWGTVISSSESQRHPYDESELLFPSDVKITALNHVNVMEVQTENLKVNQEWTKGRLSYVVSFQVDDVHHIVTLSGYTGEVTDYQKTTAYQTTMKDLGQSTIQELALSDAGVSKDQLGGSTLSQEIQGEQLVYTMEFWVGNRQFSYKIQGDGTITYSHFDDYGEVPSENMALISEAKAKDTALDHADATFSQVQNLTVALTGEQVYRVEFVWDRIPYYYDISGHSGEIISYGKEDPVYDFGEYGAEQEPLFPDIGEQEAKTIALASAGLKEVMIQTFVIEPIGSEESKEYSVSFSFLSTDYLYYISAVTGEILDSQIDRPTIDVPEVTPSESQPVDQFEDFNAALDEFDANFNSF